MFSDNNTIDITMLEIYNIFMNEKWGDIDPFDYRNNDTPVIVKEIAEELLADADKREADGEEIDFIALCDTGAKMLYQRMHGFELHDHGYGYTYGASDGNCKLKKLCLKAQKLVDLNDVVIYEHHTREGLRYSYNMGFDDCFEIMTEEELNADLAECWEEGGKEHYLKDLWQKITDAIGLAEDSTKREIWTDGSEFLVKDEESADCIADFLQAMGFDSHVGYYDPEDDERSNEVDDHTGYWYIDID